MIVVSCMLISLNSHGREDKRVVKHGNTRTTWGAGGQNLFLSIASKTRLCQCVHTKDKTWCLYDDSTLPALYVQFFMYIVHEKVQSSMQSNDNRNLNELKICKI